MPFSGTIDPTTPLGTDPVSQGDNQLRALKLALVERLSTIVDDIDADPLLLFAKAAAAEAELATLRVNGSFASPTPVLINQGAGGLAAYGRADTDKVLLGRIMAVTRELLTDAAAGALWRVSVTRVGTRTQVNLFDIQDDGAGNVEIVAEESMKFSSKDAGATFDFDGPLTELSKRVVTTAFDTADGQPELYDAGTLTGAGLTVDWANGPVQRVIVADTNNITFVNHPVAGANVQLILVQDGTGGWTPTLLGWDFGTNTPPTLAVGPNDKSVVSAVYDGTEYLAGVGHVGA